MQKFYRRDWRALAEGDGLIDFNLWGGNSEVENLAILPSF